MPDNLSVRSDVVPAIEANPACIEMAFLRRSRQSSFFSAPRPCNTDVDA